jgi:cystathionine gamma-synthase
VLSFELWLMNRDSKEQRDIYGIKDNLIRFSIGVEDFEDLKNDLVQALEKV